VISLEVGLASVPVCHFTLKLSYAFNFTDVLW